MNNERAHKILSLIINFLIISIIAVYDIQYLNIGIRQLANSSQNTFSCFFAGFFEIAFILSSPIAFSSVALAMLKNDKAHGEYLFTSISCYAFVPLFIVYVCTAFLDINVFNISMSIIAFVPVVLCVIKHILFIAGGIFKCSKIGESLSINSHTHINSVPKKILYLIPFVIFHFTYIGYLFVMPSLNSEMSSLIYYGYSHWYNVWQFVLYFTIYSGPLFLLFLININKNKKTLSMINEFGQILIYKLQGFGAERDCEVSLLISNVQIPEDVARSKKELKRFIKKHPKECYLISIDPIYINNANNC